MGKKRDVKLSVYGGPFISPQKRVKRQARMELTAHLRLKVVDRA